MHVEIYSMKGCPWCDQVKNLLRIKSIPFSEQVLDEDFSREFIKEKYKTARSFPIVAIDGFYIGGYNETVQYLSENNKQSGKLLLEG